MKILFEYKLYVSLIIVIYIIISFVDIKYAYDFKIVLISFKFHKLLINN